MFHRGASEQENLCTDLSGPWNQWPVGGFTVISQDQQVPLLFMYSLQHSCILTCRNSKHLGRVPPVGTKFMKAGQRSNSAHMHYIVMQHCSCLEDISHFVLLF